MQFSKLIDLPAVQINNVESDNNAITILCHTEPSVAACPACHMLSNHVCGHYQRTIQDLPISGHTVWLRVITKKFFCDNQNCFRKTFYESLSFAEPKAKRTERLDKDILAFYPTNNLEVTTHLLRKSGVRIKKSAIWKLAQTHLNVSSQS